MQPAAGRFVLAARGATRWTTPGRTIPIFSVAFAGGDLVGYHAAWDDTGHFRSNDGTGAEIQYVLLSITRHIHFPPALLPILRHNGILVTEEGPFALWKVDPIGYSSRTYPSRKDLCLGTDIDLPDKRQTVIRWDLPGHAFTDFHIWIKVDGEGNTGTDASGSQAICLGGTVRPAEALRHETNRNSPKRLYPGRNRTTGRVILSIASGSRAARPPSQPFYTRAIGVPRGPVREEKSRRVVGNGEIFVYTDAILCA